MVEKDKDVEDDTVEIEAHESEYILSESSADALGQEFLDAVNAAFKEDSDQDPLWTLIHHTELLPKSDPSKPRPAMSGQDGPGLELPPETLAALGEKFLGVLEHFIRLNPDKVDEALGAAAKNLPDKEKKSYRGGGRIIGADV